MTLLPLPMVILDGLLIHHKDFPASRGSLRIFNDGTIYWAVAGTLYGHCEIQVRNFPYDNQE